MSADDQPIPDYPFFPFRAGAVRSFIGTSIGVFTFLLNDGTIHHFEPEDPVAFRAWLLRSGGRDIAAEHDPVCVKSKCDG